MRRIRKYLLAGGLAVAILLAIGIALIMGSRWLTASDAVRNKISVETARLTGGALHYGRLALHLVPLPHLTALQVDFKIPGKVSLEIDSLAIYPDITALLGGAFELESLLAVRPTARIELSRAVRKAASASAPDPARQLRETAAAVFAGLSRLGPDMQIKVKDGAVELVRPDKPELKIEKVDLTLDSGGQVVALDLGCRSGISGLFAFKGKVNLATRESGGRLKLDGLNARALLAELPPIPGIFLSETLLDLEVVFSAQAAEKLKARVACIVPKVRIQRQKRSLDLQNILLKGAIEADSERLVWDIKTLTIGSQGLDLGSSGSLSFGSRTTPATLVLDAVGRRIDVAFVARSFTDFAGDQAWVPAAFNVAREGQLTTATCHLSAQKTSGKWVVADLKAAGQLVDGIITIPGADLDLKAVSGEVALDNQRVDFKQMKGRLHFGTFDKLNARIDWHQAATLGISASQATLDLEQFYPWLTAFEGLQNIRKFISTADGDLNLTRLVLSGPLTSPAAWEIEVATGLTNVTLNSPELNGPLHISRGAASFNPQTISYDKVHLKYLDAEAVTSSKIIGKPGHPEQIDLSLDGTIGEQALSWISRFKGLPAHLRIKPPVTISGMSLHWDGSGKAVVAGEIATAGGIRATADATFVPGRLQVNRFELDDGISNVSLKLILSDQFVDLDYSGRLQKETIDRFLQENKSLTGWVDGTLKATLDMHDLRSSHITGKLRGEGLTVRRLPVSPIELKRFSLDCQGKSVRLEAAELVFAGTPLRLTGTAGIGAQAYTFDLDLVADSVDADALIKIQKAQVPRDDQAAVPVQESVPIQGVIRFKTPRFTFQNYTWAPLHADIAVQTDTIQVAATRAELCGISTPGTVTLKPEGLDLAFTLAAAQQNLQATWTCLQDKPLQADSLYSLNGSVTAKGPVVDLVKNLQGEIFFQSDDGVISRANLLTKIFAFLNITEVFAGKTSGLGVEGFGYDVARAHADIQAGVLNFDEILVDGHSMKISGKGTVNLAKNTLDVDLLVAPLKTFDRIVTNMPVVGYITGGSVLSVPVRIKGSTANPEVVPLPPAAVGRGLMGILERTLKAPLKVVDSLPKGKAGDFPTDN